MYETRIRVGKIVMWSCWSIALVIFVAEAVHLLTN